MLSTTGRSEGVGCGDLTWIPVVAMTAATLLGCANEQPPPGMIPERRPPEVSRIVPAPDTVVPGFKGRIRILFDEPVNLGRGLASRLISSPAYQYDVKTGFSDIKIRPRGGWREETVYCFQLPAGISDVIGNRTLDPIDYCFSTGPPVTTTRVEGRLENRMTGRSIAGSRVLFLALPADTTPYTAVADREGAFSLRSLPPGSYWAYGFEDRNRNLRLDRLLEPHDSVRFTLVAGAGVAPLELSLVDPDSTPPVLMAALPEDSVQLLLEFDDPLALEQPEASVSVRDSLGRELPWRMLHVGDVASLRRRLSNAAGQQPAAAAQQAGQPVAGQQPGRRGAQAAREPRPARTLIVVLEESMRAGVYRVQASNLVNLRGLPGGGDTTFVYPPEDQLPPDPSRPGAAQRGSEAGR